MTLKHVLKHFSKTEVQDDKTHPTPPLEKEGVSISCAEHTEKVFSPFTSHFSQLYTPHPSPLPQGARENVSCAECTEKHLFSYSPIHLFTFKKVAFTLAEVLITLAIIGVVAAMTLPTLIQNYKKQTYVNGLKKAISTTSNMFKKMQADEEASSLADTKLFTDGTVTYQQYVINCYGDTDLFECSYINPSVFVDIIPKYIKVVKICEGSQCDMRYTRTRFEFNHGPSRYEFQSTKIVRSIGSIFRTSTNKGTSMLGFYTADGMIFYMVLNPSYASVINVVVDVNGEKGPNIMNRDLLGFSVSSQGKINPVLRGLFEGMDGLETSFNIIIQNGWVMDY